MILKRALIRRGALRSSGAGDELPAGMDASGFTPFWPTFCTPALLERFNLWAPDLMVAVPVTAAGRNCICFAHWNMPFEGSAKSDDEFQKTVWQQSPGLARKAGLW